MMIKFVALAGALIGVPVLAFAGVTLVSDPSTNSGATARSGPVACQIKITHQTNGMMALQGIVTAETAIKGTYRLKVRQRSTGGSAAMDQSGDFEAAPGQPTPLNELAMSSDGAEYDAELTINWDGGSLTCSEASTKAI